jgi:DNA helicase-2/ATP-dependent DNA helicase PcrA
MSIAPLLPPAEPAVADQLPVAPVSFEALRALVRGLNREQRQAVTHGRGPLLVLAGPGTGKTEVVTRRVARLIAAKLALPREILALTFTDNAAREMQARVDVLVPYGQADAAIHTFHAFGDRLVRDNAFELGLAGDVRLINRAEAIVVLREHVFELGLDRYLPLGDPTRFLGALVDLFGRAKEEGISPEMLEANAQVLALVASRDTDPVSADLAASRAEIARAYDGYSRMLTRQGLIDHADQIALPLRLLRERPAVRAGLQQRYRYVLVDELQDANTSQLELVLLLAGPDANVTVVGDPDQGIYDFRGASSGNVARFEAAHPGIRRVVLRRNYRSRAPIVEASRRLISHNARDEIKESQRPVKRAGRRDLPVSVRVYLSADQEADAVAASIAERIANGASPADFAVLVRSNAETSGIMRSLRVRGVPADNGTRPNLMQVPAVRSLLAFLRVVADPSNNLELYALATGEPYGLTAQQLGPQLNGSRRRSRSLWDTLIAAHEDPAGLDPATRAPLTLLIEHVRAGLERSARHTTGEVLHDYLRRSGTLGHLATLTDDGPDLNGLRGIARFVALIRGRASLLAQDRVAFLVPHLETLSEQETQIERDGPPDDDQVAVLTVHRAKGLEFNVVYICGLVDGRFPVQSRAALLELPVELTASAEPVVRLAEERRLFYVAMTRARDELWLSYHIGGRGTRRPSPFIAEAVGVTTGVQPAPPINGPSSVEQIEQGLQAPPVPVISPRSTGGPLSLSFSQVDEYLTCPERYRLRYVVGLSTPAHHALAYGSALHQAIAAFHVSQGRGEALDEAGLLAELDRHWLPDGYLSREHEEARYAAARGALARFRERELVSGVVPVAIERPFRFRLGQDQIVGRVDRLDAGSNGVVITDYKSSDVSDQKRADTKARESLQLQVYAMAHQAETGELPARVQLHFIDTGVIGGAAPDETRIDKARQKLATAAEGIRAGNFTPRPTPISCGYCPFREVCPASAA